MKSINHDLQQPLSSIKLFTRRMRKNLNRVDTNNEIKAIDMCLASADEILDNVAQLEWVKDQLPRPVLGAVPLDNVLSPLIKIYQQRAKEKGLVLNYVRTSLCALSESSYIERAVRNLLENAIEYTDCGKILVGVRNRSSKKEVEIQILDTGPGIADQHWGRICLLYTSPSPRDS